MGFERVTFEGIVIAAVGLVVGVAYLIWAMLALLSDGGSGVLLLTGSIPVTTVAGVGLLLSAGFIGTGHRAGRFAGILAFGAVVVFGRPTLTSPDTAHVAQAGFALLLVLYMVLRNPVRRSARSTVDESTSATKVGSTIR